MQKILKEKELQKNKKQNILLRFLFSIIAVLFILQITISGILATSGSRLANLSQRYLSLVSENESLNQLISTETSLSKINKEANLFGFAKALSVIYIPEQTSVALGGVK